MYTAFYVQAKVEAMKAQNVPKADIIRATAEMRLGWQSICVERWTKMEAFIDWLIELPVLCQLGLCWAFALLLLPFAQWLSYRRDCKKYGKEYADEIVRRY